MSLYDSNLLVNGLYLCGAILAVPVISLILTIIIVHVSSADEPEHERQQ